MKFSTPTNLKTMIEFCMEQYRNEIQEHIFTLPKTIVEQINHPANIYYKALYAMAKMISNEAPRFPKEPIIWKNPMLLDMGTYQGISAYMMAVDDCLVVDTIDIDLDSVFDEEILNTYCRMFLVKKDYWKEIDYSSYDFIFVDMAHDGVTEIGVHELLCQKFNGYAFYDDIDLTEGMKMFWMSIPEENKLSIPEWHPFTQHESTLKPGFGIVKYNKV